MYTSGLVMQVNLRACSFSDALACAQRREEEENTSHTIEGSAGQAVADLGFVQIQCHADEEAG